MSWEPIPKNKKKTIFIQWSEFEKIVCKVSVIISLLNEVTTVVVSSYQLNHSIEVSLRNQWQLFINPSQSSDANARSKLR